MSYLRCPLCNGKKKMIGLGMMEKECIECYGVGYVSKEPSSPDKPIKIAKKAVKKEN